MLENKVRSFELTLLEENNQLRSDRRHLTKWGVSVVGLQRVLAGASLEDLRRLDVEGAKAVYEVEWERARLDYYPAGLDYFVFDSCMFYGRSVPLGWVSTTLIGRDIGYKGGEDDLAALVLDLPKERVREVIGLLTFLRRRRDRASEYYRFFGAEWCNRVLRVKEKALKLQSMKETENAKSSETSELPVGVQFSFEF